MTTSDTHEITRLLHAWTAGDTAALEQLIRKLEPELKKLAHAYLRNEQRGHILQTTALLDEALLRLLKEEANRKSPGEEEKKVYWQNRAHFFGAVARRMRQILVDEARAEGKQHGVTKVALSHVEDKAMERAADLLALDDALQTLAAIDPRQSRVVELRFFGGLKMKEIAAVLEVPKRTVEHDWEFAKAWLYRQLNRAEQVPANNQAERKP